MSGYIPIIIKEASRNLRKNMTSSEKIIWKNIRNKKLGIKFLRQKPIYLYKENYLLERYVIPDFCSLEIKLIIEIDGSIHNKEEIYLLDIEKEKLLNQKGFKIIRIKNDEMKININKVIENIVASFP